MKNLIKSFVLMTVAVVAIAACEKENGADNTVNKPEALTITVNASLNPLQGDTKTYIDDKTIKWGTGEYMKIGVFDGTATTFGNSTDESADIWNGDVEAMFNFSITPANSASEYTYYGLYPASAAVANTNTNPASYKVNLPATQNATASSYDPKAYILVAKPEDGKTAAAADWEASFRRATALNHLTIKNISEDIKRVTITAPSGIYLAGARHFNLTASTMEDQNGDIYSGGGRTETIEVKYATKLAGGSDMNIWFTSWEAEIPVGQTLTIVAYSDAHTFTREITVTNKPITFKEGFLNTLSVNMSTAIQGDNTELEEGDYVVLAKDGDNYYALKAEKESGKERLLSVEYTGNLTSYNGDAELIWTLTKSGDSFIFENDSKYLGYKGSSNESYWLAADENWTEANYLLDVTAQQTAGLYYVTLHSNSDRYLSKNGSGAFFAFYGNTGQKADIVFVPATVDTRADVTLSFDEDIINLTTANYDSFFGQDVAASPNVTAITEHLAWSKVDNDSIIDDFDEGVLTLTGNEGSATVTVSFEGDTNYRPASASYTINVASSSSITLTSSDITAGENTVAGTNNSVLAYRLGTSSNNGSLTFGAGYATITFTLAGWASGTRSFSITNGKINDSASLSPAAGDPSGTINAGFSTSYSGTEYTIVVTDPTQEVVFSGRRAVVWGFTATAAGPATTWNLESISITTPPAKTEYTEGESFDPTGMVVTGHFVDADDNTNTKDEAVTGYTISPDGALAVSDTQVTITYQGQTANQAITVIAAPTPTYDFETIAELNTLATALGDGTSSSDAAEYDGKLTGAVVSFVPNTSNAIIKDASGSILVYKSGHGLLQGQTFSGDLTVSVKRHFTTVEITAINVSFSGSQTEVLPATMTLSQLEGNFSTYQNAYVKVEGLTVTARDGKNISVSDGTKSYLVYDNANGSAAAVDDVITAVGTIADYNGTNQIKVWASSDITITGSTPKAVTFSQPASGGSFTVSAGGNNITSGTTVASGTVVTITATAASGYSFNGWTVSGATVANTSDASTTFTMGTSAVSIAASFKEEGSTAPAAGTVLWTDSFGDWGGSSTTFTSLPELSGYTYTGRSGYSDNTDVTLTASSNQVRGTTSAGANCTSGHLWFNKSQNATVTTSAIRLYGATSLVLSYDQGTSGSSLTAGYSTDGGTTWTDFSASGPGAGNEYTFTVQSGTTSVILRFVHSSSNAKNTRFDNPSLAVGN